MDQPVNSSSSSAVPTNTAATPATALARYPSLGQQSVFITGGGTGIGAALVQAFAEQGARVAFIDIDAQASAALADTVRAKTGAAIWWRACDVRDVAALQAAIRDAEAVHGDFSTLVNNVARDDRHTLENMSPEVWDDRMAVNQRPAYFAIQAAVPGMRRRGGGAVINLGSTGWQTKAGGYPVYAVAKSSVNGLTRGLASTLGADRIRINTVSPGWVMTERQKALWLDAQGEADIQRNQCLPDKLQPSDVARMVLFLASDDGAMCTAQEFKVDAGWN
jgi:NAD(P)-dependent dehydrogenase (short-subunit alcohol dehydrogenase family)